MKRLLFSLFLFLGATSGLVFSQVAPIPLVKGSTLDCLDGVSPDAAIIRQYNDTLMLMCTRGQNKYDFSLRNTNTGEILVFEMWDRIQGVTMHLDNGAPDVYYKVNDVRISKDMCYFSGDIKEVSWEEEYDLTGSFHMVPSYYDCGYVGRFHIEDMFNGSIHYEIARVDDVVSLTRLWVEDYIRYEGSTSNCEGDKLPYIESSRIRDTMLYVIGVPRNTSRFGPSCAIEMWRAYGDLSWSIKLHYPNDPEEVLNDVIGTNDWIVFSSRFNNSKIGDTELDSLTVGIRITDKNVPNVGLNNTLWNLPLGSYIASDSTLGIIREGELVRLCRMRNNDFYVATAHGGGDINGEILIDTRINNVSGVATPVCQIFLIREEGRIKDVAYNWKQDMEPFSLLLNGSQQQLLVGDFSGIIGGGVHRMVMTDSTTILNSITPHVNGMAIWYGGKMNPTPNVRCYQGMQRVSAIRKDISCMPIGDTIIMSKIDKTGYQSFSRRLDNIDAKYHLNRYVSEVRELKSRKVCERIERDIVIKNE